MIVGLHVCFQSLSDSFQANNHRLSWKKQTISQIAFHVTHFFGLNFISLYKFTKAKLQALKWKVTSFIQKGFRRKSIDLTHFIENLWLFMYSYRLSARIAMAMESMCACTSSCTFCIATSAPNSRTWPMYNLQNWITNLPSIFENVHRVFEY